MIDDSFEAEVFCKEVQENIDSIKLITLKYVNKILDICIKNDWELNPCEALKAAFINSNDKDVHQCAKKIRDKLKDSGLYNGFTIEYIDYYIKKKDVRL